MATGRINTSLLSLPDELLSAIFSEVVDTHGARTTAALVSTCRRLAPIVRQEVYQELWVGGVQRKTPLILELCARRPDLRAFVQVLRIQRMEKENEDGNFMIDYSAEHPCVKLLHSSFPALHTLTVLEATPADIFIILNRVSATTRLDIRKLTLGCVPGTKRRGDSVHRGAWWHLLARLPILENLALRTTSDDFSLVQIIFDDARAVAPLRSIHSLTLEGEPWDPVARPALAALVPTLQRLQVSLEFLDELEPLLRQAPASLTHLTVSIKYALLGDLQYDPLARFPLLSRVSLCGIGAAALLPSVRTSRIKSLRLTFGAELSDKTLRDLVDGPARMGCLEALQLDYLWHYMDLDWAFRFDTLYDLAQVKAAASPRWPAGCSPEGLRAVVDAAHKNGIEVYGAVVDCLDWSDRFDEQIERLLVDNALASNDYTMIERYLGEDGAGKAILRQRPRLAELIRQGLA